MAKWFEVVQGICHTLLALDPKYVYRRERKAVGIVLTVPTGRREKNRRQYPVCCGFSEFRLEGLHFAIVTIEIWMIPCIAAGLPKGRNYGFKWLTWRMPMQIDRSPRFA
jgi:hypothetical protein